MKIKLSLTYEQHQEVKNHIFPGDGKEAAGLLLCGRRVGTENHRLMVYKFIPIPHDICTLRDEQALSWPTSFIIPHLQQAIKEELAIVKIHSHPTGFSQFSQTDDASDASLFPCIYGWTENSLPHGSAIMIPDGRIFGRVIHKNGRKQAIDSICVIGDRLSFWSGDREDLEPAKFMSKNLQTFGEETYKIMGNLTVAIVGCSGTGSVIIEQLLRHGVGHLIVIDPDYLESKNLNRILNTTVSDIGKAKVDIIRDFIQRSGLGTTVTVLDTHIGDIRAIKAVAEADLVFGCVDSIDGRYVLNRISTFYSQPYFDVGVKLEADGKGGVSQVCGSVHYVRPGKSSLKTRGVFNDDDLRAAMLKRFAPAHYDELAKSKYIKGAQENRPAVISLNMNIASLAILDFLSRIHGFRHDPEECARITISHTAGFMLHFPEDEVGEVDTILKKFVGRGDTSPILQMPAIHKKEEKL